MKLLLDMNLSPRWVELFNTSELPALHWSSIGPANARDSEIMAYAATNDFVILTQDMDFSSILAATQGGKPSVVQLRADDINPGVIGKQVITALQQMSAELKEGALMTIEPDRHRIRLLPLKTK
ncbi:MAG: DUF5615 family PIN-like protein [Nitrospinae bacterium]|nr:DUF5615 family PIN-like protein [Nitrospinota bacterium]MBF0634667.1 DUF5615 family PIN-like protein [Nitrospinota bacterium]